MKENTSYKIVALLITLILWVIITGSKESVAVKLVPVEFILPQSVLITNNVPHEVAFKVAGPRLAIKKFLDTKEPMIIDLSSAKEGISSIRLHGDSINTPAGVRVLSMLPNSVNPKLEKKK